VKELKLLRRIQHAYVNLYSTDPKDGSKNSFNYADINILSELKEWME
jgi:hypothetical protein